MLLKRVVFTLGRCGGLEKNRFWANSMLEGCGGPERSDFQSL